MATIDNRNEQMFPKLAPLEIDRLRRVRHDAGFDSAEVVHAADQAALGVVGSPRQDSPPGYTRRPYRAPLPDGCGGR